MQNAELVRGWQSRSRDLLSASSGNQRTQSYLRSLVIGNYSIWVADARYKRGIRARKTPISIDPFTWSHRCVDANQLRHLHILMRKAVLSV